MRGQIDLPVYGDYVGQVIKELRVIAGCHTMCLRFSGGKDSVVLKWLYISDHYSPHCLFL